VNGSLKYRALESVSVNSFAENKVTIVERYTPYRSVKWGADLPCLGRSACRWIYDRSCDARLVQSQTYGYLPSVEHCHCPLTSTYFNSHWGLEARGRRAMSPCIHMGSN